MFAFNVVIIEVVNFRYELSAQVLYACSLRIILYYLFFFKYNVLLFFRLVTIIYILFL